MIKVVKSDIEIYSHCSWFEGHCGLHMRVNTCKISQKMSYFQQKCQFKGLALVKRGYQSLKSLLEGLCHIDLPHLYQDKL